MVGVGWGGGGGGGVFSRDCVGGEGKEWGCFDLKRLLRGASSLSESHSDDCRGYAGVSKSTWRLTATETIRLFKGGEGGVQVGD